MQIACVLAHVCKRLSIIYYNLQNNQMQVAVLIKTNEFSLSEIVWTFVVSF